MKQLLVFSGLAHDAQGILAAVHWLALVGIELLGNIKLCVGHAGLELNIAAFADADGRRALLYDPQLALLHDCSLAHLVGRA